MVIENERDLIVESLYKAEDLAESGIAFDESIKKEVMRINKITEEQLEDQLYNYLKGMGTIREKIKQGGNIGDAFKITATGTGVLVSLQKAMHEAKIAKQTNLPIDLKNKINSLNSLRINRIGGSADDQISRYIRDNLS